jgi:hypothetical protein
MSLRSRRVLASPSPPVSKGVVVRDLAFVVLIAFLSLAAVGLWFGTRWAIGNRSRAINEAQWKVFEYSRNGVTHVTLELVTAGGDTLDTREVGQVRDNSDDYDDTLLTLRAKAEQRQAVLR